jgi:PAS domain S-box-containing protein
MYDRSQGRTRPTGQERPWGEDELLISKADRDGRITYASDNFLKLSLIEESDALGAQHNIVRHPEMPASLFHLMWQQISAGKEFFSFLSNMARNGDHYWVFSHVTPTVDIDGNLLGFHSSCRKPKPEQIRVIEPLYRQLLDEERKHARPKSVSRKVGTGFRVGNALNPLIESPSCPISLTQPDREGLKDGIAASAARLADFLKAKGMSYDAFVFSV